MRDLRRVGYAVLLGGVLLGGTLGVVQAQEGQDEYTPGPDEPWVNSKNFEDVDPEGYAVSQDPEGQRLARELHALIGNDPNGCFDSPSCKSEYVAKRRELIERAEQVRREYREAHEK